MKKLACAVAVGAIMSTSAVADDYQAEIGLIYGKIDTEVNIGPFGTYSGDANTATIFGEVYFDKVDTSKGPLAEASFLSKSSGVMASYTDIEDADDKSWSLGGRFVLDNDYIIEANYDSLEGDSSYGIGFGKYLTENTDLVVSYGSDDDLDALSADMHSVVDLSGAASLAYSLGVSYLKTSDESGYGLFGDLTYYFNNNFGIGAGVSTDSVGDVDMTTWALNADWFVTSDWDLGVIYSSTDADIITIDLFAANLSFRF